MDLEFQIAVQCDYLNKHRDLTFGGDKKISDYKIRYCHDCEKILPDIESCHKNKTQKLFHFLQFNHYGFDSLLYDGNTKMMVLFQIAIDRLHDLPYENLISFIEKKSENSFFKKYINFFGKLDQEMVSIFVFQWMTNKVYESIRIRSEDKIKNLKYVFLDSRIFQIYCHHPDLLKEIEEHQKYFK